ncbi:MAG: T9SS type A sorting domain-containing protein [Calditrichaceae bacterium]|nr:T9SS type A sorting domain-containing protein [Calditrichaceae bacterium]
MFKRILLSVIVNLFFLQFVFSYDWLYVRDPQGWKGGTGTIEDAVISIKPRGLYMEVGLYLVFSAKGLGFTSNDALEVEFHFDLPEKAIVHDSWLWIGDDIIRGKIMDKWTAASIYEDIVNRRRDPSILYKRSSTQYELRIYPMAGDWKRKVKITYLVPAQWNASKVFAELPMNLLQTSNYGIENIYVLTWLDQEWKNPCIVEFPEIEFEGHSDDEFGDYISAVITGEAAFSNLNFALDAPLNNGIYLNRSEVNSEGYYQMAFLPSAVMEFQDYKKVAVLVDYDASNSSIMKSEIINTIKSDLNIYLTEKDSFNLILSQLNINRASDKWIPADSISIENTFAELGENPMADYSNLPTLLANGIDFVKSNGNEGSIILVSNSDQAGDYQVANQLIDDLVGLMDVKFPIHVVDFQNQNYEYHWIGGRYYYGNEYFYTNITRLTTANYNNIRSVYSFQSILTNAFQSLGGFLSSFDLHTSLDDGFCYGRFNLNDYSETVYLDRPVLQIGKYKGSFPFNIEVSGMYEETVFSNEYKIEESAVSEVDSLSEEIWVGNYIHDLESQVQTNDVINEIIDYSIKERILSIYSAFLCLEPSRGGEICYDCMDESSLVGIQESNIESVNDSLIAYPNPFNSTTKIKLTLSNVKNNSTLSLKIYNTLGQVVRSFEKSSNISDQIEFIWNGKNDQGQDVATGNYFGIVSTPEKVYKLKLILVK